MRSERDRAVDDASGPVSAGSGAETSDGHSKVGKKRRSWGAIVALSVVAALTVLGWAAFTPHEGTLVTLRLVTDRVEFEVRPNPHLPRSTLLSPRLRVGQLQVDSDGELWERATPLAATLPEVSVADGRGRVAAREERGAFQPQVEIVGAVRITADLNSRIAGRPQRLTLTLDRTGDGALPAAEGRDAHSEIPPPAPHPLRVRGDGVDLLRGDDFEMARVGLALAKEVVSGSTRLEIRDLVDGGKVVSSFSLPYELPEPWRLMPDGDRVLLLEHRPSEAQPLLEPSIEVRDVRVYEHDVRGRPESPLIEGEVGFPEGEAEPVQIAREWFLELDSEDSFSLRSFELRPEGFALMLWGRPSSVLVGPTHSYMSQILPSQLVWLHHRSMKLLFGGILLWMLSTGLAVAKLVKG